jgi:hypothetical protein
MRNRPWQRAGVSRAGWEKAQRAVIGLIADLVWRARRTRSGARSSGLDESMERLNRIGHGDSESTRYGLDLAHADEENRDSQGLP